MFPSMGVLARTPGTGAETRTPGGGGLEPQHPGEGDHGVLGHGVGAEQRHGDQPGQRRGDDDVPVTLGPHDRVDRLDAVDHAAQVDVDGAVPVLGCELLDAPGDGDPGVVVEHVDPAVPVHHRARHGRERLPVAHVEQGVGGVAGVEVGHHHGVAGHDVGGGQRGADPAGAAGDEDYRADDARSRRLSGRPARRRRARGRRRPGPCAPRGRSRPRTRAANGGEPRMKSIRMPRRFWNASRV